MKKKQILLIPDHCRSTIQNNKYIFSGVAGKTILDAFQCDGAGNRFRTLFGKTHRIQTAVVEQNLSLYSPFRSIQKDTQWQRSLYRKGEKKEIPFEGARKPFLYPTTPWILAMPKEKKQRNPCKGSLRFFEAKMYGAAYGSVIFLKLIGLGYKFSLYPSQKRKDMMLLSIKSGQSHKIKFFIPKSVGIFLYPRNTLALFSSEQEIIANLAYQIRHVRPPTPYKGKGIRYLHESIFLKEGKKIK